MYMYIHICSCIHIHTCRFTALHLAAAFGHSFVVSTLLAKGANALKPDRDGNTGKCACIYVYTHAYICIWSQLREVSTLLARRETALKPDRDGNTGKCTCIYQLRVCVCVYIYIYTCIHTYLVTAL